MRYLAAKVPVFLKSSIKFFFEVLLEMAFIRKHRMGIFPVVLLRTSKHKQQQLTLLFQNRRDGNAFSEQPVKTVRQ